MLFESHACQIKGGINYSVPLKKNTLKIQTVKRKALGEEIQLKEHICFKFLFGAKDPHICFYFKFACVLLSVC